MNTETINIKDTNIHEMLVELGEVICSTVRESIARKPVEERTRVYRDCESDVIYELDRDVEDLVVETMERRAGDFGGVVLIAEGIGEYETSVYPKEMTADQAALRILMDPIDGTRPLMYDKRPGCFLAGVAPNLGDDTRMKDMVCSVLVEIPTSRAALADAFWCYRGEGVQGYTRDLQNGFQEPVVPEPSVAETIEGGFTQFCRFFPPGKELLSKIEEAMLRELFPDAKPGHIVTFEDQYITSGGQLLELLKGRDRLCVDVRAAIYRLFEREGERIGHVCHPYDLAGHLIGEEAGLVITDINGDPLDAPLDTLSAMDWIGYANEQIRDEVQPVLARLLEEHNLLQKQK